MLPLPKKSNHGIYSELYAEDPDKAVTFINLTIVDASESVYDAVHEKMISQAKKQFVPKALQKKVAKRVARTAANHVPPRVIAEKLAQKLPKTLMYKMYHKIGMQCAAQTVFVEDSFVVVQLQVQYVDSGRLLKTAKEKAENSVKEDSRTGENIPASDDEMDDNDEDDDESVATKVLDEWIEEQENLAHEESQSPFVTSVVSNQATEAPLKSWAVMLIACLEWIISRFLPVKIHRELEANYLPALVQSNITATMTSMMSKKLAQKSLKAESVVLSQDLEARYFFKQLQKIRGKEQPSS